MILRILCSLSPPAPDHGHKANAEKRSSKAGKVGPHADVPRLHGFRVRGQLPTFGLISRRACMEMPGRPFTRGPCPGQHQGAAGAHPPPHPEWCAPISPPLLCWHSTTFCTFQPSSDSWERIVRLFGRLINFDKQLTECNPGSAFLPHLRSVSSRQPSTSMLVGSMIFSSL